MSNLGIDLQAALSAQVNGARERLTAAQSPCRGDPTGALWRCAAGKHSKYFGSLWAGTQMPAPLPQRLARRFRKNVCGAPGQARHLTTPEAQAQGLSGGSDTAGQALGSEGLSA